MKKTLVLSCVSWLNLSVVKTEEITNISSQQQSQTRMLFNIFMLFLFMVPASSESQSGTFTYNGFQTANMTLHGIAHITPNGILRLTNSSNILNGYGLYPLPIPFKHSSSANAFSFSTTFVIAIVPQYPNFLGPGMAFFLSASNHLPAPNIPLIPLLLDMLNSSNNGNSSNHIVAVEFDTVQEAEFKDIDDNHVGIDINSLISAKSAHASYLSNKKSGFTNISLPSGNPIQVWVDYSSLKKQINVTLSPTTVPKPDLPLLSMDIDLSPIIKEFMYVGFSSATGNLGTSHYVLGWSFKINGQAEELDLSILPKLPRVGRKKKSKVLTIGVPSFVVIFMFVTFSAITLVVRWKIKYAEVVEDWELEYGPHRFSFKDLFRATKGFADKELLGIGGFGVVYKGVLPSFQLQVAVKRVSHKSKQGMREFIAEIASLGRLRHRNLVQLLGYCRRKGELLLVYEFMPNGSLDKFLFDEPAKLLNWHQRFQVIKGVASGLLYLHEKWDQVVVHRDIKASNVLLDSEFNGKLGDFGLARLYDHGTNPQTTHIVGTPGYMAPEMSRTGKATTNTDVFSFGVFMLEVACGKRPIGMRGSAEEIILVDWVLQCWKRGEIVEARDVRLGNEYVKTEMELVLQLGLLCSHPMAAVRPSMRQVMQFLDGDCPLPQRSLSQCNSTVVSALGGDKMWMEMASLYPSTDTLNKSFFESSSTITDSVLSGGR